MPPASFRDWSLITGRGGIQNRRGLGKSSYTPTTTQILSEFYCESFMFQGGGRVHCTTFPSFQLGGFLVAHLPVVNDQSLTLPSVT